MEFENSICVRLHRKKRLIYIRCYLPRIKAHHVNYQPGKYLFHLDTFGSHHPFEINQQYPEGCTVDPSRSYSSYRSFTLISILPILHIPTTDDPRKTYSPTTLYLQAPHRLGYIVGKEKTLNDSCKTNDVSTKKKDDFGFEFDDFSSSLTNSPNNNSNEPTDFQSNDLPIVKAPGEMFGSAYDHSTAISFSPSPVDIYFTTTDLLSIPSTERKKRKEKLQKKKNSVKDLNERCRKDEEKTEEIEETIDLNLPMCEDPATIFTHPLLQHADASADSSKTTQFSQAYFYNSEESPSTPNALPKIPSKQSTTTPEHNPSVDSSKIVSQPPVHSNFSFLSVHSPMHGVLSPFHIHSISPPIIPPQVIYSPQAPISSAESTQTLQADGLQVASNSSSTSTPLKSSTSPALSEKASFTPNPTSTPPHPTNLSMSSTTKNEQNESSASSSAPLTDVSSFSSLTFCPADDILTSPQRITHSALKKKNRVAESSKDKDSQNTSLSSISSPSRFDLSKASPLQVSPSSERKVSFSFTSEQLQLMRQRKNNAQLLKDLMDFQNEGEDGNEDEEEEEMQQKKKKKKKKKVKKNTSNEEEIENIKPKKKRTSFIEDEKSNEIDDEDDVEVPDFLSEVNKILQGVPNSGLGIIGKHNEKK
ncbi:uncharacterized protein MONOS_5167 [Monocercomonoides exilis]|uniref:uncharacterized protein n=1 Tax=Monocercomonoides exilis TaxID=2049356 RepID=UPI00355AA13F|nr:hypothetical protein MONOS_5167 [Monocercomonoides exilis]|eukprot:MONOS_5167.1-p1 / transcript=MONOS_5167.1 / gene=MONOS_5167 / organism=Monocercomonoides_exilis_PA203 / gene_product=unspecified product / transcript_product=unspecified product / location=Mono_scaffold00147:71304-73241(+) / protein_length=646 / sequence_SO=supercontig / SO=protein_coding / is_pseudo=false